MSGYFGDVIDAPWLAGSAGAQPRGYFGALRDPQFYRDVAGRVTGLLGVPLPSEREEMAMIAADPRFKGPEVEATRMMAAPGEQAALQQNWSDKMNQVALLGMVTPQQARGLNTRRQLPSGGYFDDAVKNTPGAQITDEGLLMRVSRAQHPDQAGRASLRGGVFYLPEGATQAKHYTTGKHGYGGSEKIAGESMFSRPLFVKGATGGRAPQNAYDQIKGKGAYEAMRSDALKAYGGWNATMEQKVRAVDEFLSKHAPEILEQIDPYDFVRTTDKGNQLAYALQEAAVGSAVRNAGYDAVLGYSMARKTKQPFISEIFDVREATYPDNFGTPTEIWESFK